MFQSKGAQGLNWSSSEINLSQRDHGMVLSEFPLTPGINRSSSVSLIPQCSEGEGGRRSP